MTNTFINLLFKGNSKKINTTSIVLLSLRYIHYILAGLYITFLLRIRYLKKFSDRDKYYRLLHTIYTIGIGLVLISLRFPFIIDIKNRAHAVEISHLMGSAGLIVLSTIKYKDFINLFDIIYYNFFTDQFKKEKS